MNNSVEIEKRKSEGIPMSNEELAEWNNVWESMDRISKELEKNDK